MRTRGWAGDIPRSDEEAVARIVAAGRRAIDECGERTNLADVARTLGVTRQTIYRYFANTDELLSAIATAATSEFLDELAASLRGIDDPGTAVVEGVALVLERLPADPYVGLMLRSERSAAFAENVTMSNGVARDFGRSILDRLDVDWSVCDAQAHDDLLHIILRTLQSLFIDRPQVRGAELRRFLRVWIAPAVAGLAGG